MRTQRRLPTLRRPAGWQGLDDAQTHERAVRAFLLRYQAPPRCDDDAGFRQPTPTLQTDRGQDTASPGRRPRILTADQAFALAPGGTALPHPNGQDDTESDGPSSGWMVNDDPGTGAPPHRRPMPGWLLASAIILGALQVMLLVTALTSTRESSSRSAKAASEPQSADRVEPQADAWQRMVAPVHRNVAPAAASGLGASQPAGSRP